jgi:hypothetical protein
MLYVPSGSNRNREIDTQHLKIITFRQGGKPQKGQTVRSRRRMRKSGGFKISQL